MIFSPARLSALIDSLRRCGRLVGTGWDAEVCMEVTFGGPCEEHKPQWMRDEEEETGEPW